MELDRVQQAMTMYQRGLNLRQISATLGISATHLSRVFRKHGFMTRSSGESRSLRVQSRQDKLCTKCEHTFPVHEFTRNKTQPDGRNSLCRSCRRNFFTLYRNKDRKRSYQQRLYSRLKVFYGVTPEVFEDLLGYHNNKCAICLRPFGSQGDKMVIDHDHKTGFVRGLLHRHCNTAIGLLKEDLHALGRAIEYIKTGGLNYDGNELKSERFKAK